MRIAQFECEFATELAAKGGIEAPAEFHEDGRQQGPQFHACSLDAPSITEERDGARS